MARSFDAGLARLVQKANAATKPTLRQVCEARLLGRLGDWVLAHPLPTRTPLQGEMAALWIPGRLHTPNDRMHWAAKSKATRQARYDVAIAWLRAGLPLWHRPVSVLLTTVSTREMDADNAIASAKPVRDQVAEMCGFNDRERLWTYAQDTGAEHGVRVEVAWP